MVDDKFTEILEHHGHDTVLLNNHRYTIDRWSYRDDNDAVQQAYEWVDTSDWDRQELMDWLGY